jgi:hypothetical protein
MIGRMTPTEIAVQVTVMRFAEIWNSVRVIVRCSLTNSAAVATGFAEIATAPARRRTARG